MKITLKTIALLLVSNFVSFTQTNFFWQNPYPVGNDLNYVVNKGDTIFIVGDKATILYSFNRGDDISVISNPGNISVDFNMCAFLSVKNIWIAGDEGTVINYNLLESNYEKYKLADSLDFTSVYFANAQHGWLGTSDGKIFFTYDGGNSWKSVTVKENSGIQKIQFFNDTLGMALAVQMPYYFFGEMSFIFKTTDGGNSWRNVYDEWFTFRDLYFPTETTGYATVNIYERIFKTTDGGENWSLKTVYSPKKFVADEICFADSLAGVAAGGKSIYTTKDGGTNWYKYDLSNPQYFRSVTCNADLSRWFAVGNLGTMYRSKENNGWEKLSKNLIYEFTGISFPTKQSGYAIGRSPLSIRWFSSFSSNLVFTGNGGGNWVRKKSFPNIVLEDVCFLNSNTGFLVGNRILKTTDGGDSWVEVQPDTNLLLYSVKFSDEQNGWACGLNGRLLKTVNAGESWEDVNIGDNVALLDESFPTAQTGYISAEQGKIFKTTDGGESWREILLPTSEPLNAIDFIDPQRGVAVGESIFTTTDGGDNWTEVFVPEYPLFDVKFAGNSKVYAVGYKGIMLYSADAGVSWNYLHSKTSQRLNAIAEKDGQIWIAGYGGTILSSDKVVWQNDRKAPEQPRDFVLYQNHPNPFGAVGPSGNSTTTISYVVPSVETRHALSLQLIIYDVLGREVATLVNKAQSAGNYSVQFDATNLPSGIYFYRLRAGSFVQTRKMVLIK